VDERIALAEKGQFADANKALPVTAFEASGFADSATRPIGVGGAAGGAAVGHPATREVVADRGPLGDVAADDTDKEIDGGDEEIVNDGDESGHVNLCEEGADFTTSPGDVELGLQVGRAKCINPLARAHTDISRSHRR
jgi:hypothetical protein